jgi:hypothetical protein
MGVTDFFEVKEREEGRGRVMIRYLNKRDRKGRREDEGNIINVGNDKEMGEWIDVMLRREGD